MKFKKLLSGLMTAAFLCSMFTGQLAQLKVSNYEPLTASAFDGMSNSGNNSFETAKEVTLNEETPYEYWYYVYYDDPSYPIDERTERCNYAAYYKYTADMTTTYQISSYYNTISVYLEDDTKSPLAKREKNGISHIYQFA